ncbi:CheR family methyltransferase [uncultured Thiodictyon sp.]|uniref:CheR family methyltransferase n=1 Tax=uncultured Thiodictyon sp. TaxID=1846217 RepID=UPI0025EEC26C|nr:CheR family methyltransferase [uncultured Thiodictyon sp.]
MNLDALKALLHARLGLCFEGHGEARLRRAIGERMAALALDGDGAYLARLGGDESELLALASLLTIKETYFYREAQHLRLLTEHLLPRLLRDRAPGVPVRILCAGCATGEEPYSIAIALRERWGDAAARLFRIDACDLDPQAIAQAREGCYRPYALRILDQPRLARWFVPGPHGLQQIAEPLRQGVAFRPMNLLADPYPEDLRGQDVIFYRNLSIYFDAATRAVVLRRLRALLRPGAYLIVGVTETLANGLGLLQLCEHEGVWYFANRSEGVPPARDLNPRNLGMIVPARPRPAGESSVQALVPPLPSTLPTPQPTPDPSPEPLYRRALALAQAERFAAARAVLAPVCAPPDSPARYHALHAHLLLEQGDLAGAATAAQRVLTLDPWSVDALVVRGRVARAQGGLDEAVDYLRRAIYARPDHWPAHFELAECRGATGNLEAARREYRIVLRLLDERRGAADQAGPLPSALPVADLRYLCRARLARLAHPA